MNNTRNGAASPARTTVRCAIYTRKSTEEGLAQEFNTLDAQRESAEAFIKSQAHDGWTCLPGRYDDGGFTGGNMDRPALKRLLADIEADRIDCVVVYKIDRLSRSLLDFAKMMDTFERHHVAFVSTTQQFNSATSMGRLVLNMLLSFAQFERELISERTRDKIAATRRKGEWTGGHPLLGYDVDDRCKLAVNEDEAARVRAIFALYLEHEALLPVVQELAHRGWANKRWTTRKGRQRGGRPFTKTTVPTSEQVRQFLGRVMASVAAIPKYLVTDSGVQFACAGFKQWCHRRGIRQRRGAVGQHGSIAVAERFILTLKSCCLRVLSFVPLRLRAFRREVELFFAWYNDRPHTTLQGATPDEIYFARPPACRAPRFEARSAWPRASPCSKPQTLVKGQAGVKLSVNVSFVAGRRHLPRVSLTRAA
jgi:DNA invertase Pin-like site-specific DNA recombinase